MRARHWIVLMLLVLFWCSYAVATSALSASALCGCDVNCDGVIDLSDLVSVAIRYGARVPSGTREDTNQDLKIDLFDLVCVAVNYRPASPTPTPAGAPVVKFALRCSQFDAPGYDDCNLNEEYVCFEHIGGSSANMTGWQVKDEQDHTYTFPAFTLPVGGRVRLHTGPGANTATDLYWGSSEPVWDDDHDTVFLYDAAGKPVDQYVYILRPASTTFPQVVCDCSYDRYNCNHFSTQAAAQACFDYCWRLVGYDIHRLDSDGNGIACDWNP